MHRNIITLKLYIVKITNKHCLSTVNVGMNRNGCNKQTDFKNSDANVYEILKHKPSL